MFKVKNKMEEKPNEHNFAILAMSGAILIIGFWFGARDINVYLNGKVVTAEVRGRTCSAKHSYLSVYYNSKEYTVSVGPKTCLNLPDGTKISVRLLPEIRKAQNPNATPIQILLKESISLIGFTMFIGFFLYALRNIIKSINT
jgi:hypothetical protein